MTKKQFGESGEEVCADSRALPIFEQRGADFDAELAGLPRRRDRHSSEEMEIIRNLKKELDQFVKLFNDKAKELAVGSVEYIALCDHYIRLVILALNQHSFWKYKFTTENVSGIYGNQLKHTSDDSLYYVTQGGISLRLKRSAFVEGLAAVIQPFFEKIIFKSPETGLISEVPIVGSFVIEYRSDEFMVMIDRDAAAVDFESPNQIYIKDGRIFYIKSNDRYSHIGDRVNGIL